MRGRGSFQFTGVELSLLAAGFALASLVIFVMGVYVGREISVAHAPEDARVARLPVEPAPERQVEARPKAAFTDLRVAAAEAPRARREAGTAREPDKAVSVKAGATKAGAAAQVARPRPAASAAKTRTAAAPATAGTPRGATGTAGATPEVVVATAERRAFGAAVASPPAPSRGATTARARNGGTASSRRGGGGTFLLTDEGVRPRPSDPRSMRRPPSRLGSAARRPEPRSSGRAYTVQVLSTRDASAAESLVRSLKTRGYGAYVRPARDSTGRWFRVRVGRFSQLEDARNLATRCRKDLSLDQAYVLSD